MKFISTGPSTAEAAVPQPSLIDDSLFAGDSLSDAGVNTALCIQQTFPNLLETGIPTPQSPTGGKSVQQHSRRSQTDGKVHYEYMKGRPLKELLSDPKVVKKLAWIIQHVS